MSRLGRISFRESGRSPFLTGGGADFQSSRNYSEQTSREIDLEVKRIIDESIVKVKHILETRRVALEALTARLLEREVIDSDELREVIEQTSSSPSIVPGTMVDRKPRVLLVEAPPINIEKLCRCQRRLIPFAFSATVIISKSLRRRNMTNVMRSSRFSATLRSRDTRKILKIGIPHLT